MKILQIKLVALLFLLLFIFSTKASNSSKVNLFIGTSGDNGQVDPGAAVPFGMVRVCPDSDPRSHAGYDYSVDKISGISVNRLSGVGCSGAGGNFSIKPARVDFDLRILKNTEKAVPGYYESTFNNGVKAQLTATHNIAVQRYFFPVDIQPVFTFNIGSSFERAIEEQHNFVSDTEIEGFVVCANVCGRGKYKLFFNLKTNKAFTINGDKNRIVELLFAGNRQKPVEFRIALSSVSTDAARKENQLKSSLSFSKIKASAARLWNEKLSKITVAGGTADDQTVFYTSLYRVYLSPANVTSADGQYLATDGKIHHAGDATYYSSWSLWDTYRTKFPLLVLLEPKTMSDMAQSLVRLYQTGKQNWSTDSEATPTVRTEHAVMLLLDAYRKGIENINFEACYNELCREAAELPMNSPDQKLESACDLWALAQIADIIGNKDDATKYETKANELFEKTWTQEFLTITPSFIKMGGNGLYQGTRWQYRWAAPQFLPKMIELCTQDTLKNQLTYFFENHMFNQGNEPDIHVPFLFNRLGAPDKTQQVIRELLTQEIIHKYGGNAEFKTPYIGRAFKNELTGFMPEMDEDDGTMGAWYVFSAMGVYPLVVGEPVYELSSPLFDKLTIDLEQGKTLTIVTKNRKKSADIIREIHLNGKPYRSWQLPHSVFIEGGVLEYTY